MKITFNANGDSTAVYTLEDGNFLFIDTEDNGTVTIEYKPNSVKYPENTYTSTEDVTEHVVDYEETKTEPTLEDTKEDTKTSECKGDIYDELAEKIHSLDDTGNFTSLIASIIDGEEISQKGLAVIAQMMANLNDTLSSIKEDLETEDE